ncbi:MAG: hypothetical protein S0880_14020 [Actinomycetota bacterium]|nr:hypothetical protein [Actinomycetota bacterium]
MDEPTTYHIVIRGRAGARVLHPFVDDFVVAATPAGDTSVTGPVTDAAHLHGLLVHLTSLDAEVVSANPVTDPERNLPS